MQVLFWIMVFMFGVVIVLWELIIFSFKK
jgi:hypothetical protein